LLISLNIKENYIVGTFTIYSQSISNIIPSNKLNRVHQDRMNVMIALWKYYKNAEVKLQHVQWLVCNLFKQGGFRWDLPSFEIFKHIILAIPFRPFETTNRSHLQGSKNSTRTNELNQTNATENDMIIFPINFYFSGVISKFYVADHTAEQKFTYYTEVNFTYKSAENPVLLFQQFCFKFLVNVLTTCIQFYTNNK